MKNIFIIGLIVFLSGCTISKTIDPVESGVSIEKIYIQKNTKDHMEGFLPELASQIDALGFETEIYIGEKPDDAVHYITYQANWAWDLAMYLVYFHATLYETGNVIGEIKYDAKMGGANMGKFGTTSEKIKPLLNELFVNVKQNK